MWKCALLYPLAALPVGLGLLMAYWYPHHWLKLTASPCSLDIATYVIVKVWNSIVWDWDYFISCSSQDIDGNHRVEVVRKTVVDHTLQPQAKSKELSSVILEGGVIRFFEHRHLRYLYRSAMGKFVLLRGLDAGHTLSDLHQMKSGLLSEDHSLL